MVHRWAGEAREKPEKEVVQIRNPHVFYGEGQAMVETSSSCYVFGNIKGRMTEEITKEKLITYLIKK